MLPAKDFNSAKLLSYLFVPAFSLLFSIPQWAQAENAASEEKNSSKVLGRSIEKRHFSKPGNEKKAELEYMSSDDTVPGYFLAVDPVAHYKKAKNLAIDKKYNEALLEVNEALKQNPQYYEARYLGALIYQWQGRKQEAANKYKYLLVDKPNYLQARISYGTVLSELNQNKAAEVEYKKAIEISFSSCDAHYNFANLLIKENRFKEALGELKICRQISPDNAAVHNNLGVVFLHEHSPEQAQKEFRLASELDPASKAFLANLERSHDKKKVQSISGWY